MFAKYKIKQPIIFRALVILLAGLILAALILIYLNALEHAPFKDNEVFIPDSWEISLNQSERWENVSLPTDIRLRPGDAVTVKTVLPDRTPDGAVLFFRSKDTLISVSVDGEEIYAVNYDGKYIGWAWNFIELPKGAAGKILSITHKEVLDDFGVSLRNIPRVEIANRQAAVFSQFNRQYLLIFYGSTVLGLVAVFMLLLAFYLLRKRPEAKKLKYLSVMFMLIAGWSLSESPLTQLYFSGLYLHRPYMLTYISYLSGLLFTVPLLLYAREYYGKKKPFEWPATITVTAAIAVCFMDLMSIRTITESFPIILTLRTANLLVFLAVAVISYLTDIPKQNKLIPVSDITMCILGIFEAIRWFVFNQKTVSQLIYAGMALFLSAKFAEAVASYLKSYEDYQLAQTRGDEILRSVEVQHNHYKQLAGQVELTRRVNHDLKQFRTVLYGALQQNEPEKAKELLEQIDSIYKDMKVQIYCDNMEIDSIISYAGENCKRNGIEFIHDIRFPETIAVPVHDLCVVIGNLLDNAIEAASKCAGRRAVEITAAVYESNLVVKVENTYSGKLINHGGVFKSTKENPDRHGLGISIVQKIAEATGGETSIDITENTFSASVMWGWPHDKTTRAAGTRNPEVRTHV